MLAWVAFAEHDAARSVRSVAAYGLHADYLDTLNLRWADGDTGRGPVGTAIRTCKPQVNHDFASNDAMQLWRDECVKRGFGSSAALPLTDASAPIGAFVLVSGLSDAFDSDESGLLMGLADDVSYGLTALRMRAARDELSERIPQSMEAAIGAMAGMLDVRDPYTAGHQRRVAKLAAAIAMKLGLSPSQIHGLRLACMIHDIGKISIPAEILNKPGKLSRLEYELIKEHVDAGYQIIKNVDFPWPIGQMTLQHHERLDGTGYPKGLKERDILLEARIIAVADVVDAVHSFRPYRPALGIESALAEIDSLKGTQLDLQVVSACIELFRSDRLNRRPLACTHPANATGPLTQAKSRRVTGLRSDLLFAPARSRFPLHPGPRS